jgi:hypothetical protein
MVPTVWIEQTTYRLQGGCSTTELCGQGGKLQFHILAEAPGPASGNSRQQKTALIQRGFLENGAEKRSRTPDLRITNALLYQLSYFGT